MRALNWACVSWPFPVTLSKRRKRDLDTVHSSSKPPALVLFVLGLVFKDLVRTAQENYWQVYSVNVLTCSSSLLMVGRIS